MNRPNEFDEVRAMLVEQIREMRAIDPADEDRVKAAAVKTQTLTNCAKVYNDMQITKARVLAEKLKATKYLEGAKGVVALEEAE